MAHRPPIAASARLKHLAPFVNPNGIPPPKPRVARHELPWVTRPTNIPNRNAVVGTSIAVARDRYSGAKGTALQTLSRLPDIHKPREASGLRRVDRAFSKLQGGYADFCVKQSNLQPEK